ncbi:hypothetical protein [Maribacter sp. Asnod2-G09]|uniref:hypothetical protein n=1 Tax=Maribacter sp. Asnod2-G09 TaxID=3160577 RepID=UPI00386F14D3
MKSKLILLLICLSAIFSCSGEFIASKSGFINLSAPDGKCEEGSNDPTNENKLKIVFSWDPSESTFENGELIIKDNQTKETVETLPINVNDLFTEITLDRNKWYSWQISATEQGASKPVLSDEKMFYSELILVENAPYPVLIKPIQNNTEQVIFEWESPQEDPSRDNLRYKTYYTDKAVSEDTPISSLTFVEREVDVTSSTYPKRVTISTSLLEAGINYLKVESILTNQNNTELKSTSYWKFTVSSNP